MALDKPSNPEDEYFAKESLEKVRELRKKLDKERLAQANEQEKTEHWMRCPKCGGQMKEENLRSVAVDVCTRCGGIYFDKGELDILVNTQEGFLREVVRSFRETFRYGEPIGDGPGDLERK